MWSRAAACYDHNIEVVDEDGVRIERWYFHLWTVPVRQEQVRSPGKTSRIFVLAWRQKTKKIAQSKLCTQDRVVKRESASLLLDSVEEQETAM